MKQNLHFLWLTLCIALLGFAVGCDDDDEVSVELPTLSPKVALELGTVTTDGFTFKMTATDADAMAYLLTDAAAPQPEAKKILAEGTSVMVEETPSEVEIKGLEAGAYCLYAAATHSDASTPSSVATLSVEIKDATAPAITLKVLDTTAHTIRFEIMATGADQLAYLVIEDGKPSADDILSKGQAVEISDHPTEVELTELRAETRYKICAAAHRNDKKVVETVTATTLQEEQTAADPMIEIRIGEPGATDVKATFSATDATHYAALCLKSAATAPTAEEIFAKGEPAEIGAEPAERVFKGLEAKTDYVIYAAAKNGTKLSDIAAISFMTAEKEDMLTFIKSWKTGFSYRIAVGEDETCFHCYVDGWNYEHMLAQSQIIPGFDINAFNCNLLVDLGIPVQGKQNITWEAGCEDKARNQKAMIVGGKTYYILACRYVQENAEWVGKPEVIRITDMEPAGRSNARLEVQWNVVEPQSITHTMFMDEGTVNFFFYDLYPTAQVEKYLAEEGEQWLEDAVYYSGYSAGNTYTDQWNGLQDGTSYTLCITGVDLNGDVFFQMEEVTTPKWTPEVRIDVHPYENEMNNQSRHDTVEIIAEPQHIAGGANPEQTMVYFDQRATFEATLDMIVGMHDLDAIRQNPELQQMVIGTFAGMSYPLSTEEQMQLQTSGYVRMVRDQLNAETEYACMVITSSNATGELVMGIGFGTTERDYSGEEQTPEYKAFLGEWEVTGIGLDFETRHSYKIRIEAATPNRTYKVYGWSAMPEFADLAFTAEYDETKHRMKIFGEQECGRIKIALEDGSQEEMDLVFTALLLDMGEPTIYGNMKNLLMYECEVQGNKLAMFPNFLDLDGKQLEVYSMLFTAKDLNADYYLLEDAMLQFGIYRPQGVADPRTMYGPNSARMLARKLPVKF